MSQKGPISNYGILGVRDEMFRKGCCGTFNKRNNSDFSISIVLRNWPSRSIWISCFYRYSLFMVMGRYARICIELGGTIKSDFYFYRRRSFNLWYNYKIFRNSLPL